MCQKDIVRITKDMDKQEVPHDISLMIKFPEKAYYEKSSPLAPYSVFSRINNLL